MTYDEMMKWNGKGTLRQYQEVIDYIRGIKSKLNRISYTIDFEQDAVDILKDDSAKSEAYKKHLDRLIKATKERDYWTEQLRLARLEREGFETKDE